MTADNLLAVKFVVFIDICNFMTVMKDQEHTRFFGL